MEPKPEAYQLLHDGSLALAQVEHNGIRIDTDYLEKAIVKGNKAIKAYTKELRDDPLYAKWRKKFGAKINLDSGQQLQTILRGEGIHLEETEAGNFKTDAATLAGVDLPFVDIYSKRKKAQKVVNTFLMGIRKETAQDGRLHPFFNLHTVSTYRSSSDSINFQNLPVRDPNMGKIVRQCFTATGEDHVLIECDYSGIEVCIAAAYHKDPNMISYIKDPTKDMHRDMAAQCFMVEPEDVSKHMRYCGKNMFVFPQFYGDVYASNARAMWDVVVNQGLETAHGCPVKEVLTDNGINSLGPCDLQQDPIAGTFEYHIKEVQKDFWGRRFAKYGRWKEQWWKKYRDKNGGFETKTGFVLRGQMRRNEVINYPVQGSAFHCLLWSLIRIQKKLNKQKMRTKIVGQIHDSIVADVHVNEVDEYLQICKQVMTIDLPNTWTWINVPLSIEAEQTPPGGSWHEKEVVPIP